MIFGSSKRRLRLEAQTQSWLRSVVRSGLQTSAEIEADLRWVLREDLPYLDEDLAPRWMEEAYREWAHDAAHWPALTDYDRLQAAFDRLATQGLPVLVGCEDHWAATAAIRDLAADAEGLVWFTPMDVWHAVDEPMLEVNVWNRDAVNQREGSSLVVRAVMACGEQGLEAHFDEGRLEIAARWQRRPDLA